VLDDVEKKNLAPTGTRTPAVQPVASRYTYYAMYIQKFEGMVVRLEDRVLANGKESTAQWPSRGTLNFSSTL
jgi:hypothetical protein